MGVDYESAMSMSLRDRYHWCIAMGIAHGGEFDFQRLRFKEPQVNGK